MERQYILVRVYKPFTVAFSVHKDFQLHLVFKWCLHDTSDTEGSFMVERALQIAEASVVDMSQYNELLRNKSRACRVEIQPTDILEKIYYFRICSYTEQIALINYLDKFISEHKDVGYFDLECTLSIFKNSLCMVVTSFI